MKILLVTHEYPPVGGGGANACYYLSKEFAGRGHQVTILTTGFEKLPEQEVKDGVRVLRVNSKRRHKDHSSFREMLSYLMKALPQALKLCREEPFDLCLACFGIPSGPIARVLKMRYKLPYVIRFGGGDVPGFQKRFKYLYKLLGPCIRNIWKHADALIVNSEGLKAMASRYDPRVTFSVIPNGVDTAAFCPGEAGLPSETVKLLFVSRLIERKGLQHILQMLTPDDPVMLTVVGDGPYRETLEQIVKERGLQTQVSFEGHKEHDELRPYYQNADLFLLPSEKEGMPNVVLEAMACGLPILMTRCEGADELIHANGYAVSLEQYEDRLRELITDPKLRASMGRASQELAKNHFSWTHTADQYEKIMEHLIL